MTSFDFTWTEGAKPAGKAFARKRTKSTKSQTTTKPLESRIQTKPNNKPNNEETARRQQQQHSPTTKLVKRKQKKDKLAAKAAFAKDDDEEQKKNAVEKQSVQKTPTTTTSHSLFSVRHKEIYVNTDFEGKSVVEKVFSAEKKFSDLQIHRHLLSNLEKNDFTALTKVQEKAIPLIMDGKNVLIRSQTGSGKTLAYAVPIVDALQNINPRLQRSDGVQALIVVPTRELALQTHELFGKINTFQWIVVGHLCGGENRKTEKDRLRKGVHVLIGTPGRLLDHILHTSALKIHNIRCLVLDEADRLLDMGFKKDVVKIVEEVDKAKTNAQYDPMALLKGRNPAPENDRRDDVIPPLKDTQSRDRQTILLSATLNKGIAELADFATKDHVFVDTLDDSYEHDEEHMIIPNTVRQEFVMVYAKHRLFTLAAVLLAQAQSKVFVFMATTQMVNYHHELFTKYLAKMPKNRGKLKSGDVALLDNAADFEDSDDEEEIVLDTDFFKLHGNMDQEARKDVFKTFRAAKRGVLLCTDVAARGVDVPEADCIVQYTGPQTDEDYLHRVGRTGRAGKSGSALIFLTHEEQEYIARLQEHKVFLKKRDPEQFLKHLCVLMEEPDEERAAAALQRRFEAALAKDKELHKMACFAYSSWSRFYNTYPHKMRTIFNFKNVNLGHYVTSFGLKETPSDVARIVRGQVTSVQGRQINKKLAIHSDIEETKKPTKKRKIKSVSLTTSEFASGLEPAKKKKKKKEKEEKN